MLEHDIKEQLKSVFAALSSQIDLVYHESSHTNHGELVEMLQGIAETSSRITTKSSGETSAVPSFRIYRDGIATGVNFVGIPGGHEFTSLIVAILNADGKGKMPDSGMQARIKSVKGPIRIKTYISLTCENCPDVVQALNQMALIHPDFQHQMIDGAYAQEEISALGIQGVPSVIVDSKMIHSGRIDFLDLLKKVEEIFGIDSANVAMKSVHTSQDLGHFDVVVLGGGPAGASAAIYSARKGLKTALVAELMGGQVKDTKGIENLISVIYTEGPQLAEQLYKHLESYAQSASLKIFDQRRVASISTDRKVTLESGETLSADAVIVTTGAKWRELGVPGEKDYIGRGVAYCPHCDGPFYKGKKIAVVGGGNSGVEAAIDLAGIAGSVVLLEFGDQLRADKVLVDKLNAMKNTSVITNAKTTQLVGDGQKIFGLEFLDRKSEKSTTLDVDGVFVQIGLLPNSKFLEGVVSLSKFGEIVVDEKGRTNIPGIYAAGDVTTTPYKQIIIAMGEGAKVALAAFEDKMRATS